MRRGRSQSVAANPVLVGAVTLLVAIVAVFLAYNANNGLPFVPTREINVQIVNGSDLVAGNDVREGGFRIGVVEDITPVRLKDGRTVASLKLKLDQQNGKLPVDTRAEIRPRSVLGLKYVQITRGRSKKIVADGGDLPVNQSSVPVQFEDLFTTFDAKTRKAAGENLRGFGDMFAARGTDLNLTIQELPELLGHLAPVAANLADPNTQLVRLIKALNSTTSAIAPVAAAAARSFGEGATTFEALSHNKQALQSTIEKAGPTLAVGTDSLRAQRPFLTDLADLATDLNPATRELRAALPDINPALEAGTPVLRRSVKLSGELKKTLDAVHDLAVSPTTFQATFGLNKTARSLNPQLRFLGPYQTVCNYWGYFWTFIQEHLSEQDPYGYAQRTVLSSSSSIYPSNSVGAAGAAFPSNYDSFNPITEIRGEPEHLIAQTNGAAIDTAGNADCEAGQRGFPMGRYASAAVPAKYNIVTTAHSPGNQGPTYKGRARVPAGQTYQREPDINPVLDTPVK